MKRLFEKLTKEVIAPKPAQPQQQQAHATSTPHSTHHSSSSSKKDAAATAAGAGAGAGGLFNFALDDLTTADIKHPLCTVLTRDDVRFRCTVHHGIPTQPTCISFDPVQRILAIGSEMGLVKVFGGDGIEVLVRRMPGSISHLQLLTNRGILVCVQAETEISAIDLDSGRLLGSLKLSESVTCMRYYPLARDFVYLGTESGAIKVLCVFGGSAPTATSSTPDVATSQVAISSFAITPQDMNLTKPGKVVSIVEHPADANTLLIAHAKGSLLEYNLAKQMVDKLEGKKVAAGFDDGTLLLWRRRPDSRPHKQLVLTCYPGPRRHIRQIHWTRFQQRNLLVVLGGTSETSEPDGILVRYLKEVTFLAPPVQVKHRSKSRPGASMTVDAYSSYVDMAMVFASPYSDAIDPSALMALSNDAQLSAYFISPGGVFPSIAIPPNLLLQPSALTCSQLCLVSRDFVRHLVSVNGSTVPERGYWPVDGGELRGGEQLDQHQLFISGHENGRVYFWDASRVNLVLLYTLDLTRSEPAPIDAALTSLHLCVESRIFGCACRSGEALVFFFNLTPRRVILQQFPHAGPSSRKPSASSSPVAPAQSSLPALVPAAAPVVVVPPPATAAPATAASPSTPMHQPPPPSDAAPPPPTATAPAEIVLPPMPQPPTPPQPAAAPPAPFTWFQFFVNAGVAPQEAQVYHDCFEHHRITEDLLSELDNDMMEMAGITAVGDRLRIRKYIKTYADEKERVSQYASKYPELVKEYEAQLAAYQHIVAQMQQQQQQQQPPAAAAAAAAVQPGSAPVTPVHRAAPPPPADFVPPSSPAEQPQQATPVAAIPPCSPDLDRPRTPETPFEVPECEPGYQLNVLHSFESPISRIRLNSRLSMVAVGDTRGTVAIFDLLTGWCLLNVSLAKPKEGEMAPVSWICFDDEEEEQMTPRSQERFQQQQQQQTTSSSFVSKSKEQLRSARSDAAPVAGLFVLVAHSQLFYIDLQSGYHELVRLYSIGNKTPNIRNLTLLNAKASPCVPRCEPWVNLLNDGDDEGDSEARKASEAAGAGAPRYSKKPPTAAAASASTPAASGKGAPQGIRNPRLPNKYLLTCTDRGLTLYEVPGYALCFFYESAVPPIGARVATYLGDNCVLMFNASGDLEVLSLSDLTPMVQTQNALQRFGIRFSSAGFPDNFWMLPDGRVALVSLDRELVRASLFASENKLNLPQSVPRLVTNRIMPEKSRGFIGSLFGPAEIDWNAMFGTTLAQAAILKQRMESEASRPRPATTTATSTMPSSTVSATRPSTASSSYAAGASSSASTSTSVGDVHDIMRENARKLQERGEKINAVHDDSNKLQSATEQWLRQCEEMARQQKEKKWWEF